MGRVGCLGVWEFSFGNIGLGYQLDLCLEITSGSYKDLHFKRKLWTGDKQLEIEMEFKVIMLDQIMWM